MICQRTIEIKRCSSELNEMFVYHTKAMIASGSGRGGGGRANGVA